LNGGKADRPRGLRSKDLWGTELHHSSVAGRTGEKNQRHGRDANTSKTELNRPAKT